jgi:hypothetical protein
LENFELLSNSARILTMKHISPMRGDQSRFELNSGAIMAEQMAVEVSNFHFSESHLIPQKVVNETIGLDADMSSISSARSVQEIQPSPVVQEIDENDFKQVYELSDERPHENEEVKYATPAEETVIQMESTPSATTKKIVPPLNLPASEPVVNPVQEEPPVAEAPKTTALPALARAKTMGSKESVIAMAFKVASSEGSDTVNLTAKNLSDMQVNELIRSLKANSGVRNLDLSENKITDVGFNHLAKAIAEANQL